jgi:hypothetical protein
VLRLFAPRIDDTTDVTFGAAAVGSNGNWSPGAEEKLTVQNDSIVVHLPAASAALLSFGS